MDVLLLQAIDLRHPRRGDIGVGGMHHQGDPHLLQLPQLGPQLLIGMVADNKPRRKTAEVGKIQELLTLCRKAGLHLNGRHGHTVGQQQAAVANQHPAAIHPGGNALPFLTGNAFHRFQVLLIGDHPAENSGQRIIHAAQHAGRIQDSLINGLFLKGSYPMQGNTPAGEQVAAPQQNAVGIMQLLHGVFIQQVGTPAVQPLIGAAQRHMAAQCGRQGRGDAQCRCKDRNRLEYRSLGQEVFQQRHYHCRQYGNGGQHPTDALGHAGFLQHGLGILRQTGIIQRHRLFRLLRQLRRPFSQAALRQGAAGHRPQGGHGPAAFPLAGILHQLAPGIKEQDKYRQRQEDIVPILLQQGRLCRHKAALQQAGKDR